jgi:hypothetical protein
MVLLDTIRPDMASLALWRPGLAYGGARHERLALLAAADKRLSAGRLTRFHGQFSMSDLVSKSLILGGLNDSLPTKGRPESALPVGV